MSNSRTDHQARLPEEGVFSRGWLTVDLAGLPTSAPNTAPNTAPAAPLPLLPSPVRRLELSAPAVPAADPAQDNAVEAAAASPSAVPENHFVVIGRGLPRSGVGRRRVVPPIANDNLRSPGRKVRSTLREILFLCVLAATLAGTFWTGRVHAMQKIIVVPEPMDRRVVLT